MPRCQPEPDHRLSDARAPSEHDQGDQHPLRRGRHLAGAGETGGDCGYRERDQGGGDSDLPAPANGNEVGPEPEEGITGGQEEDYLAVAEGRQEAAGHVGLDPSQDRDERQEKDRGA